MGPYQPLSLKLEPEPHPHWKPDWKSTKAGLTAPAVDSGFWTLHGSAAHMKYTHALEWKV